MANRGPRCTVCSHERRHQIELGIIHKVSYRVLASRFDLGLAAIYRHAKNHLSPAMRAALLVAVQPNEIDIAALEKSEHEGLLASLVHQRSRLQTYADMCVDLGDPKGATTVERAITTNLELVARLLGQLVMHHQVSHTSIMISADYIRLRTTIINTLEAFPEASRAMCAALANLETEAATEIAATKRPLMIEAKAC